MKGERALGLALALTVAGCGPKASLWVSVGAPLVVPAACDGLTIQVQRASDSAVLFKSTYALDAQQFPQTLELTTGDETDVGVPLQVVAQALKSGQLAAPWATAAADTALQGGKNVAVTLSMCACATPPCGCPDGGS